MFSLRKCQKLAALGSISGADHETKQCNIAKRGHVIIQTIDGKRFMVPLAHLKNNIFIELFRISEEEFGIPSDGPVVLPCSATSMECILSLLQKRVSKDERRAIFTTILESSCSISSSIQQESQRKDQLIYGF